MPFLYATRMTNHVTPRRFQEKRLPQLASLAGTGKWLQEISFRVLVTRRFNELKTVIYRIVFKPPIH